MTSNWEQDVGKIVVRIIARKDSEMFREPVPWEALGLTDYPEVVKKPMDLGTVKTKLDAREYRKMEDAVADIRLIWSNAMHYNAPGCKVYTLAKNLSDFWENQWASTGAKDDPNRPPSLDEMSQWVDMCHRITSEQLGQVLAELDTNCSHCLSKKSETNEVEVNLDLIPGKIFREVRAIVQNFLPEVPQRRRKSVLEEKPSSAQPPKKMAKS